MRKRDLVGVAAVAAGAAALVGYALAVRPWHLRWGATDEELKVSWPGDELTPGHALSATHAITINAPASEVWPWLVQVGQNKGGFYSYTWLENLVGCQMPSADRIVPEFQRLEVGDRVWLHPKVPPLPVLICEPHRAIVLGSNTPDPGTWGFFLSEINANTTRLVIRGRGYLRPGLANWLFQYALFEPAHFIMERKLLLEIKRLAEGAAKGNAKVQPSSVTEEAAEPVPRGANMTFAHPLYIHQARPYSGVLK